MKNQPKAQNAQNPRGNDNFALITEWAHARNLIDGSDSFRQLAKLTEEMGELAGGIAKQRPDVIADSIGDCAVVLTILAAQNGLTINDCIQQAYDEIKDRKGRMIDGVFIKEGDLPSDQNTGGAL